MKVKILNSLAPFASLRARLAAPSVRRRKWGDRRRDKTDWARVDVFTDAETEATIEIHPDWRDFKDID
ncbi:protein of unknown function [Bradyrhizobium vignae]|uniref:Uncharacterized protein n=1 Tax=Bradyrhizobium vignae TaxID=1549949 RepID=A0A2U3Q9E5_9BRAD|nr:protein of unknown function [Bradyrhizobium vignae]